MNDDGTMSRLPDLLPFATKHGLKVGTIADLIHYRAANESMVERVGARTVRTAAGPFELVAYRDKPSGAAHLALVHGQLAPDKEALVRVHEPLSVLDLIDTDESVHSWPVHKALRRIAASDGGVLVMLNCADTTERLFDKFNALLKVDVAQQVVQRATKTDLRTYGVGAQILRDLNVSRMKLLAKPRKMPSMTGFGLQVTGYLET
jgi:3,4-dihydroxy 2-butanone 4-phosphate synthase/GTP cyclohydrolase II